MQASLLLSQFSSRVVVGLIMAAAVKPPSIQQPQAVAVVIAAGKDQSSAFPTGQHHVFSPVKTCERHDEIGVFLGFFCLTVFNNSNR